MTWLEMNAPWLARARRWLPRAVEPLRMRVWLSSPVAWDGRTPITIEGALQFVVVGLATGRSPDDVFAGCPHDLKPEIAIPVADVELGGRAIACASIGWPPSCAVETVRWRRKRARVEAYGVDRLMIAGGWGKSLNIPVAALVTPFLDFYLRGDRRLLAALCRELGGLGRDSTRGLGSVVGVELDPDPEDRSLFLDGAPQRALPLLLDGGPTDPRVMAPDTWDEREATTRAPYWHRSTTTLCAVPVVSIGTSGMPTVPLELEAEAPREAGAGAAGRFFITPKAVRRFIERFAPELTYEPALAELIRLTSAGRYMAPYLGEQIGASVEGAELWRAPRVNTGTGSQAATSRMRFVVGHGGEGPLPQVVTVLPRHHGGGP